LVRCFASQEAVDRDLGWEAPDAPGYPPTPAAGADSGLGIDWAGGAYTIAYWDINYGGSALTIWGSFPDLPVIGWNDAISSIKSVNCGQPRYYQHIYYGGWYWQNGCNEWSPNLYSANDQFSSVVNMAP
jgi:hypothetical protein